MLSIPDVQVLLTKLGYFDGEVDGDPLGTNFRDDLRRFQRDYPSTGGADGWYGPKTDAVLRPMGETLRQRAPAEIRSCRRWQLTHYYVSSVRAFGAGPVPIFDREGPVLAHVAPQAFVDASLEGSSVLADGRLINVSGFMEVTPVQSVLYQPVLAIAKRNGWVPTKPGYAGIMVSKDQKVVTKVMTFTVRKPGLKGWPVCAKGIECDPFRTVAADNGRMQRHDPRWKGKGGVVPAGTKVFILELVGVRLPDGTTHDGWVTVNDTGGAIKGAHFDVFTGVRALAKQVRIPALAHIWFEGIEERLPFDYAYGLNV